MNFIHFVLIIIAIYILQFLILPLTGLGINIFIPFALIYFISEKKISEILVASLILDVFMGLPFPLMTISLLLTFTLLFILYTVVSTDSGIVKIFILLPISLVAYWLFVYFSGSILGFFINSFHIPFSVVFNPDFIWNIVYATIFGSAFYILIKSLKPQELYAQ